MRHIRTNLVAVSIMLFLIVGCARNYAPDNWLPTEEASQQTAYGGWARLEWGHGMEAQGELIAVTADSLFVLTEISMSGLALDEVDAIQVMSYESGASVLGTWTLLGSLSTISHGVGLLISLPVWLISGSAAASTQSRAPLTSTRTPLLDWEKLRPYARFPQGIPSGMDRGLLAPKAASASFRR